MAYDPQGPYAITQFKIDILIPIELLGVSLSFTNSSLAMVSTVLLLSAYLYWALETQHERDHDDGPHQRQGDIEETTNGGCTAHARGFIDSYDLEAGFATRIIGGPGSFVVTADGNAPFAEAVRRKLLLEIAAPRRPSASPLARRSR